MRRRTDSAAEAMRRPRSSSVSRWLDLRTIAFRPADLAREGRARLADGVPVRLHHGDRLGGLGGKLLAAAVEGCDGALLEVGDAGERRLQALSLRLVLRDRDRERALGALDPAGRVADLLVEDQQGAAVGELLLGAESRAADQGEYRLEHRSLHCYRERRSPTSG